MSFVNKMPSADVICNKCIHKKVCCYVAYDIHNCADFFELVKCEDCKHRSKLASEDAYGVEDWTCNHDYGCAKCDDGDFCHYGERKEKIDKKYDSICKDASQQRLKDLSSLATNQFIAEFMENHKGETE